MFKKKEKTINLVEQERNKLVGQLNHARKVLESRVRTANARVKMLAILPETSAEYKNTQYELVQEKMDVVEWMHSYELCRHELDEFCMVNNLRCPQWACANQVVLQILEK